MCDGIGGSGHEAGHRVKFLCTQQQHQKQGGAFHKQTSPKTSKRQKVAVVSIWVSRRARIHIHFEGHPTLLLQLQETK